MTPPSCVSLLCCCRLTVGVPLPDIQMQGWKCFSFRELLLYHNVVTVCSHPGGTHCKFQSYMALHSAHHFDS
ncbi:uncharacterized protein F5147DRAFT_682959 [Suillus discolor]|uniref:Secreted protein n=1 Tax=Suillus discolor TaxID=1912936 RepID=A0A9P7FDB9_9AGAM|nr:uncharacterized protein F5147DRAFT_682959 [Suillus discolor]KAG2113152.1 hypothetical protein F5147DRAFT_682959 [Suillus discolor]